MLLTLKRGEISCKLKIKESYPKDDQEEIYFKLGLYRDHMEIPMRIIYDRFRRGTSYEEVSISEE